MNVEAKTIRFGPSGVIKEALDKLHNRRNGATVTGARAVEREQELIIVRLSPLLAEDQRMTILVDRMRELRIIEDSLRRESGDKHGPLELPVSNEVVVPRAIGQIAAIAEEVLANEPDYSQPVTFFDHCNNRLGNFVAQYPSRRS